MASLNLPIVKVDEFCKIVETQFNEKNYRPIFGLGKGGIGKTESIMTLAKEKLNVGYIDIRLLLYAETDLKGIPYPDSQHIHTIWLQNDILPRVDRDGKRGILVLDEITSVQKSVRTAAYQLLNERKLGEYTLPDGWLVVCLGNGEDDGGDFQGMEGNFANRCSIYNVVADVESWKDWASRNNINYLVTAYVSWRPSDLHTYDPESDTDILFASPRSWKAVSDILNAHPYNKDDVITNVRILGNLGNTVGNMFTSFCKYKDAAVEPIDIVNGKVKEFNAMSIEVLFLTIQGVIKLISDETNRDIQNNGGLTMNTLNYWANGVKWMLSLDSMEHKLLALKDLIRNNQSMASQLFLNQTFNSKCPELGIFINNNSNVFK